MASKQNADGTKRELTKRHVQMIALGGTIGTGLFLGASNSIMKTGPSILLVYLVLGVIFFLMMRGIGEMMYHDPDKHTFHLLYRQILRQNRRLLRWLDLLARDHFCRDGRTHRRFQICPVLVSQLADLGDSNRRVSDFGFD